MKIIRFGIVLAACLGLAGCFPDSDGDGLTDLQETCLDWDGDTAPNCEDQDSDADGKPDADEGAGDVDGDGIPNFGDTDDTVPLARTLQWGGRARSYGVYVPPSAPDIPLPLVVVLHGSGQNANQFRHVGMFSLRADVTHFLVAYPQAVGNNWNDGRQVAGIEAYDQNIDDVGFINAMVDAIDAEFGVARSRVYLAGFSNGGMMAMRLAIETPDSYAAIGTLAASLPVQLAALPEPESAMPTLMINSIDDPVLPYTGGTLIFRGFDLGTFVSVQETIDYWVDVNGANAEPLTQALPDIATYDGCTAQRRLHAAGDPGADVLAVTLSGAGHSWAGGPQQSEEDSTPVCYDINATDMMVEFFAQYERAE